MYSCEMLIISDIVECSTIRSESTLPVPLPSSDPPTPTRLAGTQSEFVFEDRGENRGDLINFYNAVSRDIHFIDKTL